MFNYFTTSHQDPPHHPLVSVSWLDHDIATSVLAKRPHRQAGWSCWWGLGVSLSLSQMILSAFIRFSDAAWRNAKRSVRRVISWPAERDISLSPYTTQPDQVLVTASRGVCQHQRSARSNAKWTRADIYESRVWPTQLNCGPPLFMFFLLLLCIPIPCDFVTPRKKN